MNIQISREIEARLADEARRQGVSVDTLLERLMNEHDEIVRAAGSVPELPVMRLGAMGPLHRRDIYDDVR